MKRNAVRLGTLKLPRRPAGLVNGVCFVALFSGIVFAGKVDFDGAASVHSAGDAMEPGSTPLVSRDADSKARVRVPPVPGVVGRFLRATRNLSLTGEGMARIGQLEQSIQAAGAEESVSRGSFESQLALSIGRGLVDDATLRTAHVALTASMNEQVNIESSALRDLHDMLQPTQRKLLTRAVRTMVVFADGANARERTGERAATLRRLQKMSIDLALDPGQQKKLDDLLSAEAAVDASDPDSRVEGARRNLDHLLAAFDQDTLDGRPVVASLLSIKSATDATDHRVAFFRGLVEILTSSQRETLAWLLRSSFVGPTQKSEHDTLD
jgi:hypothetical protein